MEFGKDVPLKKFLEAFVEQYALDLGEQQRGGPHRDGGRRNLWEVPEEAVKRVFLRFTLLWQNI